MRAHSNPNTTTPAASASIGHDGEIDTRIAIAVATSSLVPAHKRRTTDSRGTSRRNVSSGSRRAMATTNRVADKVVAHDPSAVELDHAFHKRAVRVVIVRNHNQRHAMLVPQRREELFEIGAPLGVETGERFVEHE